MISSYYLYKSINLLIKTSHLSCGILEKLIQNFHYFRWLNGKQIVNSGMYCGFHFNMGSSGFREKNKRD